MINILILENFELPLAIRGRRFVLYEPKPNHFAKKNLFFPREASFSACAATGEGDGKGGEISLAARINDVTRFRLLNKEETY